ncbi:hypothetical protein [Mycolicibacterium sp. TY81]|uniref:hypothetical protein n=1 Tax=Mycolicibacterium sp. TY81 TaxID=2759662 RepID=UPI001BB38693|nr:hypothetical protein [Mycolicibacterium sp. TY81]
MDTHENDPLEVLRKATNLRRDIDARYDAAMAHAVAQGLAPADVATAAGITYSAATKAMRKVRSASGPFPEPPAGPEGVQASRFTSEPGRNVVPLRDGGAMREITITGHQMSMRVTGEPNVDIDADGELQIYPTGTGSGALVLFMSIYDWRSLNNAVEAAVARSAFS